MLKVGFYLREMNYRGIANSIYLFAQNNQSILKNKSFIFYNNLALDNKNDVIKKFQNKFTTFKINNFKEIEKINKKIKLDYIYFQRGGIKEKLVQNVKNLVHAVFPQNIFQYHGFRYAYISSWLSKTCSNNKFKFVPLPILISKNKKNLRDKLKISKNSHIFGYHGGETSFDLDFVKDAIQEIVSKNLNIYFVFMNIKKFTSHRQIIFLKGSFNIYEKNKFLNTCDAMIHARSLGESFGISCAEFAAKNKPILTYGFCRERAHFDICKKNIIPYFSYHDLVNQILNFKKKKISSNIHNEFSETKTIKLFNHIFLKRKNIKPKISIIDYIITIYFLFIRGYFYIRHKLYINFYKIFRKLKFFLE